MAHTISGIEPVLTQPRLLHLGARLFFIDYHMDLGFASDNASRFHVKRGFGSCLVHVWFAFGSTNGQRKCVHFTFICMSCVSTAHTRYFVDFRTALHRCRLQY